MGAFQSIPDDVLTGALTTCVLGHWPKADDRLLVVRTTCDVPRGVELCLSYVDTRLPAAVRVGLWLTRPPGEEWMCP